jgi:actin-related protein
VCLNFRCRDLTEWLQKILNERGHTLGTVPEREIVCDMKDKFGYVALDFESEFQEIVIKISCGQPNGNEIMIGTERFDIPELLFRPPLNGFEIDGIDRILFD